MVEGATGKVKQTQASRANTTTSLPQLMSCYLTIVVVPARRKLHDIQYPFLSCVRCQLVDIMVVASSEQENPDLVDHKLSITSILFVV